MFFRAIINDRAPCIFYCPKKYNILNLLIIRNSRERIKFKIINSYLCAVIEFPMMQNERYTFLPISLVLCCLVLSLGLSAQDVRSIDGFGNNQSNPELGTAGALLRTLTTIDFDDGYSTPAGRERENPRVISNYLFEQTEVISDARTLSDYNWVFGQFIDHDLSLVENADPSNSEEVLVIIPPVDDKFFSPDEGIFMMRSKVADGTGLSADNPRKFVNEISSFLDGSGIYGSDEERAIWLRSFVDGKLKVSANNLLPWNTSTGEFNSPIDNNAPHMADDTGSNPKLFVAGDVRANENPMLIAIHTLFVREHNRNCDIIKEANPAWTDEEIYQHARRLTVGALQAIVYNEWLPAQGIKVPDYQGYNEALDPTISNVFSAAAFRMGHTLINSNIIRMDNEGLAVGGSITLKDAFFNPTAINLSGGIDPFLKGMATQVQQELDCKIIDDVRNFLFGAPGEGGLDLAAININRGRERGLPDYNRMRIDFGLPEVKTFEDICSQTEVTDRMKEIYGSVDNIDPWVGMLAEDHMTDAIYGELSMTVIERQFRLMRDGDRFYYENDPVLSIEEKNQISNTIFHDLIARNTDIILMQDNVFTAMPHESIPNGPDLPRLQLSAAIFPNPVSEDSRLKVYTERAGEMDIAVYDNFGRLIREDAFTAIQGDNIIPADYFNGLSKGAYNIKIENDLGIFTVVRVIL